MRRLQFIDFYIPKRKWELVEFLKRRYPKNGKKFERWRKKRLYAVYFQVRGKDGVRGNY